MPTFPGNPLENLAFDPETIDQVIELGDASAQQALDEVEQLLKNGSPGLCLCLRFPPAKGDGKQTLFQPLGHHLLQARREGRLERCLPASDGCGYVITIASKQ